MQESSRKLRRQLFPTDVIPEDVGSLVTAERQKRRWSQARLAERAGISRASVYRLEAGRLPVLADTLFRIAHALDLPIQTLVPGWPESEPLKCRSIGEAARDLRRARGLSLAEVARKIGVTEGSLSRFERGLTKSRRFVRRVAEDEFPNNDDHALALGFPDATAFSAYLNP